MGLWKEGAVRVVETSRSEAECPTIAYEQVRSDARKMSVEATVVVHPKIVLITVALYGMMSYSWDGGVSASLS